MDTLEYPMTKSAKVALYIAGGLCCLLVFALPFGVWIIVRTAGAKLTISPTGVVAKGLLTHRFDFADVEKIGLGSVPVVARGVGGALARQRVGGDSALHVVVKNRAGKTKSIMVSPFERHQEITAKIAERVGKPYEPVSQGAFGLKFAS